MDQADRDEPTEGEPASDGDDQASSAQLPEKAQELLRDWQPGKPILAGTYFGGAGARKRKPLTALRSSVEEGLGI
jgi:hypothetical protein